MQCPCPGELGQMIHREDFSDIPRTEAFNLVSLSYQGQLENVEIPSFVLLGQGYRTGQITAMNLVEAAVEEGRISANALEDESYLNAVDFQLQILLRRP